MPSRKHMHFSFSWLKLTYYGIYEWRGKSSVFRIGLLGVILETSLKVFCFFFFSSSRVENKTA